MKKVWKVLLKMHYSKIIISILLVLFFSGRAIAENWIVADNNSKRILIDTDSINVHNQSVYYNIRYYENSVKEDVVATIQAKGDMAGIVNTCKYSDFVKNPELADSTISSQAKKMNKVTPKSLLYNANLIAADSSNISGNPKLRNIKLTANKNNNEVDFSKYMETLQASVKKNWNPPKMGESKRVVLLFKVSKEGALLSCKIDKSSGSKKVDQAAIAAVKLASPFEPLPNAYKGDNVDIQFTFDYNVIR